MVNKREWQPIETAPKDGTKVDLWIVDQDGNGERVVDAEWVADFAFYNRYWHPERGAYSESGRRDGWYAPNQGYDYESDFCDEPRRFNDHPKQMRDFFKEATHWMPVPEPPK